MLEQRRLRYLSTLGIDTFVPRRRVQGAKASAALLAIDLPDNHTEPELAVQQNVLQQRTIQSVPPSEPLLHTVFEGTPSTVSSPAQADTIEPKTAQTPVTEPVAQATAVVDSESMPSTPDLVVKTAAQALSFVLNIRTIAKDLIVVDTHQPGSALPVDKLLQNMLFAMGYPLAQLPPADLVRWPIFKNDPNNNPDEARAMVQANLNARCLQMNGDRKVLLMGATAAEMVLDKTEQEHGYCEHQADWQASLLYLPSLMEILQNPASKKAVWRWWQGLKSFDVQA